MRNEISIKSLFLNFDNWSDKIINQSLIGKLLFKKQESREQKKNNSLTFNILLSTVCILFLSLSLPQFANDRFGMGLIIIGILFIFLINACLKNILCPNFNSVDFLIILFMLTALISTFSSYFFKESLLGCFKYLVFFIFFFMVRVISQNCSRNKFLFCWLFFYICAFVISVIGIYQYVVGVEPLATWEDPASENIHTRVYSTLGNPNLLAGYLLTVLPIGFVMPFIIKRNLPYKIIFLVCNVAIFMCIIFTGSRGGYIGLVSEIFVFTTTIFLYLIKPQRILKRLISIIILLLILIIVYLLLTSLFPIFKERFATIFLLREHSSNTFRTNVWLASLKMLKDNWLIGIGAGNNTFRLVYGLYMISGFDALGAYNIFLQIAIETGIVGFLTFVFIFLISFLKLHYIFWERGNIMALGIFASLIGLITHGMVDTVFFRPQIFIPFWFLLASIAKLETEELNNVRI